MNRLCKILPLIALLAFPLHTRAQARVDSGTGARVFSTIGPGFRAIRRGPQGHYYVLTAPNAAVLIFDSAGKNIGRVPAKPEGAAAIRFGTALDVDASGRLYVADQGADAVNVYAADGSLLAHVHVPEPMDVAALPGDEFAVLDASGDNLLAVYDFAGTRLRAFGDLADIADDPALNRRLNLGHLATDGAGNLYYAFAYLPEPTVRKYDAAGYLTTEMSFDKSDDFQAMETAARREIARAKRGVAISPLEIISAIGVDAASQEIWLASGETVLHFDPDGKTIDGNNTYTGGRTPFASHFILVEPDRLLLGNDPFGVYDFPRPAHDAPKPLASGR